MKQKHNLDVKGIYLGIDASLTCTGLALLNKKELVTWNLKPKVKGVERLAYFNIELMALFMDNDNIDLVCVEGYAHGKQFRAHQIGELGGVIRLKLHNFAVPFVEIPPKSLKKFVTGAGTGEKSDIKLHLYKRWGFTIEQEDEADAAGCALAAMYLTQGSDGLTKQQKESLEKISHG
jgi:crossover junction endodeoxyribonuclease RuvC